MHDIKTVRLDPDGFDAALARRGATPASAALLAADATRRAAATQAELLRARRNSLAEISARRRGLGPEAAAARLEASAIKAALPAAEAEEKAAAAALASLVAALPNLLDSRVPDGPDETANVVVGGWGQPGAFAFAPKEHDALGRALGLMDFEAAAQMSGARFVVLRGGLARLQRALGQFMLDLHTTEHGYAEIDPPLLVQETAAFGTGQLPKFSDDLFRTSDGRWLIPTAEMPLTNLVADRMLRADELPLRFAALTPCFRSEAGAAGKDTRGMIRQHQFHKVELVSVVHPEAADAELLRMRTCAETVLQRLDIPYRVLELCGGDTGFSARRTFDLEAWLPGQGRWREISSCSECGAFQARRMNARFKDATTGAIAHPYTLNGSGVAVGRALVAVIENYQRDDGSIAVPEVLLPYMGGATTIGPNT